LSKDFSAIEPPTWGLLLAQSCRAKGFGVAILDCGTERLSIADSVKHIAEANPRQVCLVVYGQNPNSGTTNMIGATALARSLKQQHNREPQAMYASQDIGLVARFGQNPSYWPPRGRPPRRPSLQRPPARLLC
jgi:hypothetical protein